MSNRERAAAAAIIQNNINNPPTQTLSHSVIYNVGHGTTTAPTWLRYDTPTRYGVKINTGHTAGLGTNPIEVSFRYRTYGAPNGLIRVGVRKISNDEFVLIAEHPVQFNTAYIGQELSARVMGQMPYSLLAGDHVVLEYPANATSGIEIPASTSEAFPTNTVSQVYTGSWANTASNRPLAVSIKASKSVAI
jgi:hypothetical protein